MTSSAFLMLRLNDHIQYMKKVQQSLNDQNDFDGVDCHHCKLGEWLYGEGPDEIKAIGNAELESVFQSLFEPHQQYHDASQKAIQFHQAQNQEEAKKYETEMIVLSNHLVNLLLKLDALAKVN